MHNPGFFRLVFLLILGAAVVSGAAACKTAGGGSSTGTRILQPGAPGQDTRTINTAQATDLSKVQATPADVKFMQGMIGHHAQAVEMVALIADRSANADMKMLGLRIRDFSRRRDEHDAEMAAGSRRRDPRPTLAS